MKIIVVGGGKVGTALCRSLVAEKHDVILIEQDEAVLNQITKRYDIIGIAGNGANFKILEQADVSHCDIFISRLFLEFFLVLNHIWIVHL